MKWARFLSMCCALLLMVGADSGSASALRDRVMIAYANGALQNYERADNSARAMLRSVQAFCAAPDEALLA
jgi:predicted lipoprotein